MSTPSAAAAKFAKWRNKRLDTDGLYAVVPWSKTYNKGIVNENGIQFSNHDAAWSKAYRLFATV